MSNGISFNDLPLHMQSKIIYKLSDACDIINLGKATPTMQALSENRTLWKKLCHFHFSDKTVRRTLHETGEAELSVTLVFFSQFLQEI